MRDFDYYSALGPPKEILAEDIPRGTPADCVICWNEHDKTVTHKSKFGALRHLRTVHPWYWRIRESKP